MFSGITYCVDCGGGKLYYCTSKSFETGKTTLFVPLRETREKVPASSILTVLRLCKNWCYGLCNTKRTALRRKIIQAERHIAGLSPIFKGMFEDNNNISGKLNDARFAGMSADYETESSNLQSKRGKLN